MARFDLLATLDRKDGQTLASLSRALARDGGEPHGPRRSRRARRARREEVGRERSPRLARVPHEEGPRARHAARAAPRARRATHALAAHDAGAGRSCGASSASLRDGLQDMITAKTFKYSVHERRRRDRPRSPRSAERAHVRDLRGAPRHVRGARSRRRRARRSCITGEGRAFCSGGDVEDIIGELFSRDMKGMLAFTRVTGALIENIRKVRRPVVAAVNGVAVGAGAVIALACDMRIASEKAKFGFIFPRWASAARTWARRTSFRASSASGARASCSSWATSSTRKRRSASASSNRVVAPDAVRADAREIAQNARRGPRVRARHDEADARERAHDAARRGDRGRGAGPGDLHDAPGFPRRVRRVEGFEEMTRDRLSRRRAWDDPAPFYTDEHRQLARSSPEARSARARRSARRS